MLHTKSRGNRFTGSGEDVLRFFTIYGHGGHLCYVTQMPLTNPPRRLHIKFGFDWPSSLRGKYL